MKKIALFLIIICSGVELFGQKITALSEATSASSSTLIMAAPIGDQIKKITKGNFLSDYVAEVDSSKNKGYAAYYSVMTAIAAKLAISDTANMLANYINKADTSGMLENYLNLNDDTEDIGTSFVMKADTFNYSFQVGLGLAGDTSCFRKGYVMTSFNSMISDTINVDSVNFVARGSSPDVDIQMYFDANFDDATPTSVFSSSLTVTSTTTGNGTTSFANAQIPPGKKVYFRLTEATKQPTLLMGTVFYHIVNRKY
jgi:hypothetical protein